MRRYASAGGVVIDRSGQRVLILLRPDRIASDGKPEARLPKGHIEHAEDRQQAAVREVREESGLTDLHVLRDLGSHIVEFDYSGQHVIRDESYFLMRCCSDLQEESESQFRPCWLPWDEAIARLSYEQEREWLCGARSALAGA